MSKATTIEKNNRFYEQPDGKVLTENEQLKEWLKIANESNDYFREENVRLINKEKELLREIHNKINEIERLNNIINEILTFGIYKKECPMTLDFEDNCLEGKAQKDFDIYMNCDEHCGCGLEDNHNECWLKYFERLQELKGEDKE